MQPVLWEEKQLGQVLKSKTTIKRTFEGRNKAENNLQAALEQIRQINKHQVVINEYKMERNAKKIITPKNAVISQPQTPIRKVCRNAVTLKYDKFVLNDPENYKNYTKNLNDKYYSGRDFDIRMKVDEEKVTKDGKKIKVEPAK